MHPISQEEFLSKMELYEIPRNKLGLIALLYWTGVRISEALALTHNDLKLHNEVLYITFKVRLKGSKTTEAIQIPIDKPHVNDILYAWWFNRHIPNERLWTMHRVTAWRLVKKHFPYPHYFRLNRVTNLFRQGWTIAEVRSFTGLSLQSLDFYIGLVSIENVGKSLR